MKSGVNMINSVNNSVPLKSNNFALNESSNKTIALPPELKVTFEKMISQLDLVSKTIKIFDQRIQNLEGHITTLSNRQKKNFVRKQPPQMGDYQYLMENSGSNYLPNNSVKNTDEFQKYTNLNNMDYYTAEISNQGSTFKEAMNINDENKKNMYKTVDVNKINNESTQNQNNNQNEYMGQIHEEYGYNQQGEEGDNEQYDNEEYVEGDEEQMEQNNEQQGEEYEEFQEEQYNYEEQYEEGNYGEEEQIEQMEEYQGEEGNGEEEVVYGYDNENNNEDQNNNNEQENPN
jgi:hypothetical protein